MELTVKPIKKKHAGRSLAAVDNKVMEQMGIDNSDYVSVAGDNGEAVVRTWPGYDEDYGTGVIRIDGKTREQAGVGIDDTVEVEKQEVQPAQYAKFALPDDLNVRGDITKLIKKKMSGKPIKKDEEVPLSLGIGMLGGQRQAIPLSVVDTDPSGYVLITETTEIEVVAQSPEQVRQDDESRPDVAYEDIGGLDEELTQVREMIELPMRHPELFNRLGIDPPKGVLLHGPPGTGKTLIAKAVANEVDATFHSISGPEIMSKYYGESEEQLREIFEDATENSPAVIFMDELDSIASQREEAGGDVERRVVAQLLSLMDGLEDRSQVVVIGATNRVDAIDPALRRGGRFDREIEVGVPDKEGRREILDVHTRNMPLGADVSLETYSESTHGFVGADLEALCKESAMSALRRVKPQLDLEQDEIDVDLLEEIQVTDDDFKQALRDIEPSALREVFVEVPDVTWDDVGGLQQTKERLREVIQWPLNYPDVFEDMGMESAKGVLMYGPPGTGKTLLAKAVANEAQSNFISIKGPELLNKYVGESEKGVREVFEKARSNAPTVVFFDEIDAIAGERGGGMGDNNVSERVVSQLLTELDGLEELEDVVVIATTNRPDLIDSALLRPGRLDRHIHVPVPDRDARRAVLDVHLRDKPVAEDVDLDYLAEQTDGYVGADIQALCREASMAATRDVISSLDPEAEEHETTTSPMQMKHFEHALDEVVPSVTEETREEYNEIEQRFQKNSSVQSGTENERSAFM